MEQKIFIKLNNNFDNIPIPKESLKSIHELLITNSEFEPTTIVEILYTAFYWELKNDKIFLDSLCKQKHHCSNTIRLSLS